jgi:hypothetical protein
MMKTDIELRSKLAEKVYLSFDFYGIVVDATDWKASPDNREWKRNVTLSQMEAATGGRSHIIASFTVRFTDDNTVASARADDKNGVLQGFSRLTQETGPLVGGISRRAATAAGRNQGAQPGMPEPVRIALEHVASIFPEVTHVFFSRESRWFFCDDNFDAPTFDGKQFDIGLLEDAADCLETLPAAFTLVK